VGKVIVMRQKCIQSYVRKTRTKDNLENLNIDETIILKLFLKKSDASLCSGFILFRI
jgi:hypothetical protein